MEPYTGVPSQHFKQRKQTEEEKHKNIMVNCSICVCMCEHVNIHTHTHIKGLYEIGESVRLTSNIAER